MKLAEVRLVHAVIVPPRAGAGGVILPGMTKDYLGATRDTVGLEREGDELKISTGAADTYTPWANVLQYWKAKALPVDLPVPVTVEKAKVQPPLPKEPVADAAKSTPMNSPTSSTTVLSDSAKPIERIQGKRRR